MGREIRMVPKDWEHPKKGGFDKNHMPLFGRSYSDAASEFMTRANANGLQDAVDWCGCPDKEGYMPEWKSEEKTHLQMYETCSEGTPISPVMETPEALARWLADNGASSFGHSTASYEQWLRVCKGGYAPSAIITEQGLTSGVAGLTE